WVAGCSRPERQGPWLCLCRSEPDSPASGPRRLTLVVSPERAHGSTGPVGGGGVADSAFLTRLRTGDGPSHLLLVLLNEHRVMTTDQLAHATGTPERTVRYRLDQLHDA